VKFSALVVGRLILSGAALPQLHAQNYVISTFAGGGAPLQAPAPGLSVPLGYGLYGIATDPAGNVYVVSTTLECVFKLDPSGVLTRIAGNGRGGYSGDGGPATEAQLNSPSSAALDGAGGLFIAEVNRVRRVSPSGIITTIAGNGQPTYSGDGGPAADAQLSGRALAVDHSGNLFVADPFNYRIRKITPDGLIATIAGNGSNGSSGDNGPATAAQLSEPNGIAVDSAGNLFIIDGVRVRKVSTGGIITTVAGGGSPPCCTVPSGDGGPATSAVLFPQGVTTDRAGNLYITDMNRLRKVTPDGILTTVAGNGSWGYSGDGGPATSAQLQQVVAVALDGSGNMFIVDAPRVRRIAPDGVITTMAGNGRNCCFSGDGGPATGAQLNYPSDVAVDASGNVFIADTGNNRIRKVSPDGVINTVTASATPSYGLYGLTVDPKGSLLIVDSSSSVIRRVALDGSSTIVAGNGAPGQSGDGGPATSAQLAWPTRVTTDRAGNIFIMDNAGSRIRKVSPDGIITTLAGVNDNFYGGFSGDGGPAVDAQLDTNGGCDGPGGGMAADAVGDLYFADTYNSRIRQIDPNGIIHTAGGGTSTYAFSGDSGDGGPLNNARFFEPFSVAFDPAGNLFIADFNNRIRKVTPDAIITTVAGGGGSFGLSGDGGLATAAGLQGPAGIAADGAGNIYIADTYNNSVRVLRPTTLTAMIKTVVDAASQRPDPLSPGKVVTIYGLGLGPSQLTQNQPTGGVFSTTLSGTSVTFNGIAAPILYTSAMQVGAVVPYSVTGSTAQVAVTYQGQVSNAFAMSVAPTAPSLFTRNQTGAGQAVAVNVRDGSANTAANPAHIGGSISVFATGAGQTAPAGVDGNVGGSTATRPLLPVSATIGGIPATVQSVGAAQGQAGVMQATLQVPAGVQPGGYVPVVLQVGNVTTTDGAVWIAVSGN
jgi:uncharacterized protein (TIGR03437 family)